MKKLFFAAVLALGCLISNTSSAQISVNLGINIGSQPDWGPVGYDHASYYYMPDIDTYYDVPAHRYVYYENNTWVRRTYLPARYSTYNVYNGYKVVINESRPWLRNDVYRTKYSGYKGRGGQPLIRDSKEEKYKNHWNNGNHYGAVKHKGNGGGNGNGRSNGKGHGNGNGGGHGKGNGHGGGKGGKH